MQDLNLRPLGCEPNALAS